MADTQDKEWTPLAGIGTVAELPRGGEELGLGLSRLPYVSGGTNRIEFDPQRTPEGTLRSAFYLRYISDYITWWNNHGLQNIRELEHQRDDGMGVSMFSSMKEMIAAMMVLSSPSTEVQRFRIVDVVAFMRNA